MDIKAMYHVMGKVEKAAYDAGLRVGTWHPGDGATRYRFFRETAEGNAKNAGTGYYDYFGGSNALITVLGRKAAFAFIEAFRLGRNSGIREASAEVIPDIGSGGVANRHHASSCSLFDASAD
jgi:hypothetical protein